MQRRDHMTEPNVVRQGMPNDARAEGLANLDDLDDYEIADGEPDIRGWDVATDDGRKLGEVKDLLVDVGALEVRYLVVELKEEAAAGRSDRRVLVPIGRAQLDEDNDAVLLPRLPQAGLAAAPPFPNAHPTDDDRRRIDDYFADSSPATKGYVASLRTSRRGPRP